MISLSRVLMLTLVIVITGCGDDGQTAGPVKPTAPQAQETQQDAPADLPPAGEVVVGDKPPMPDPIRVARPDYQVTTVASGLVIPWDLAFLPDGRIYVTERPGRVRVIEDGKLRPSPYATVAVRAGGEGGLMGIALHPDYPDPAWVYVMYTYEQDGRSYNRVSRFSDTGTGFEGEKILVTGIPGATYHDGGAVRFGPDGKLYVGTGDAGRPELAQDPSSPAGKVLRYNPDGSIPADNPFPDSPVYALGLRNVQGLAWNPSNGDLWATMHGPSGEFGLEAKDEVFVLPKGANAGWPRVLGVTKHKGAVAPVLFFPESAVPPSGAVFYDSSLMPELRGNFLFASLRGEHLARVVLKGPREIARIEQWFATGTHNGVHGRLRAVAVGPDGSLYVSTSNRDRGQPRTDDDRIIRIRPR